MKGVTYIKERMFDIVLLIVFLVFFWLFGMAFRVQTDFLVAMSAMLVVGAGVAEVRIFIRRRAFYADFLGKLEQLDEKYYITEMVEEPDFQEGKILWEALYEIDKSMKEHINETDALAIEFKEYLEMWVHEMKVPLSGLTLMNYNESVDYKAQRRLLQKLNHYVEQVLFYARADASQKDYLMKKCVLEQVVNKVLVAHKDLLIEAKMGIEKEGLEHTIITDMKWLEFILGQIVNNSVKYRKTESGRLCITAVEEEQRILLRIEDDGIGIPAHDIERAFDKTFTGENGRKDAASTGMGLYICKKLCDKLGHKIWLDSEEGVYTRVTIAFGKNAYYDM